MAEPLFSDPFGQQARRLIGCEWGRVVALPADMNLCHRQATRRVVVHGDEVGGQRELKLCDAHYELVASETDPHAGAVDHAGS